MSRAREVNKEAAKADLKSNTMWSPFHRFCDTPPKRKKVYTEALSNELFRSLHMLKYFYLGGETISWE